MNRMSKVKITSVGRIPSKVGDEYFQDTPGNVT